MKIKFDIAMMIIMIVLLISNVISHYSIGSTELNYVASVAAAFVSGLYVAEYLNEVIK